MGQNASMTRPDYVRCISSTRDQSWCGEPLALDWYFQSTDHAILAVKNGSRMLPCPNCLLAVIEALDTVIKAPAPWRTEAMT